LNQKNPIHLYSGEENYVITACFVSEPIPKSESPQIKSGYNNLHQNMSEEIITLLESYNEN